MKLPPGGAIHQARPPFQICLVRLTASPKGFLVASCIFLFTLEVVACPSFFCSGLKRQRLLFAANEKVTLPRKTHLWFAPAGVLLYTASGGTYCLVGRPVS